MRRGIKDVARSDRATRMHAVLSNRAQSQYWFQSSLLFKYIAGRGTLAVFLLDISANVKDKRGN